MPKPESISFIIPITVAKKSFITLYLYYYAIIPKNKVKIIKMKNNCIIRNLKILVLSIFSLLPFSAKAVCPVCTVAVGAGLGISRSLGIDDTISGVWIGAVIVSISMWTINWFKKKNINFKFRGILTFLGYVLIGVVPLYFIKGVWHPNNTILGINKLGLGIVVGMIVFYGSERLYEWMKEKNGGKAHFPFEKVVLPLVLLLVVSFIFYVGK